MPPPHDRFTQILGPYLDHEVLNVSNSTIFPVTEFTLRHGHQPVGLDNVWELIQERQGVQFRGNIKIKNINWLSDIGKRRLQEALYSSPTANGLKLERAIAQSALVVIIQGKLFSEPLYLREDNPLVFFSGIPAGGASKAKKYSVETIQVLTDSKSKVFRARWSALRALEDIHNADRGQTPQESRKEKWLLEGYMDLVVTDHAKKAKSSGTTFLVRKPHRSEIKNVFGRHAVWLREHVKRMKLLNMNFWDSFIRESRGRLNGEHHDDDELDNASSSSKSSREPDNMDQTPAEDPNNRKPVPRAPLGPEGYAHTFTYLEEDATSSTNQQDKHFCHALNLLDIPLEPFQRPVLSASLDWHCPFSTCNYYVDLRNLVTSNDLSLDEKKFLQSKFWNGEDDDLLKIFYDITERHNFRHLDDLHIGLLVYEKNVSDELVSSKIRGPDEIEEGQEGLQLSTRSIRRRSHLANVKAVDRKGR